MPEVNLALELMVVDYLKIIKTIDETLRNSFKKGEDYCIFTLSPDKVLESWIYEYTQNNGFNYEQIKEGKIKISFRKY